MITSFGTDDTIPINSTLPVVWMELEPEPIVVIITCYGVAQLKMINDLLLLDCIS